MNHVSNDSKAGISMSDGSSQERKQPRTDMTDIKFAVVPHSTRNKDNTMGLTQPVFPRVGDKLG